MDLKFKSSNWKFFVIINSNVSSKRLGGIMPRTAYEASLVMRRQEIPHKCARVEASNNDIHNVTKSQNFSSCRNGQHGGIFLSNEDGIDKKSGNGVNQQGDLGLPLVITDYLPEVKNIEACQKSRNLKDSSKRKLKDFSDERNTRHIPICLKDTPSAFPIYVMKNGPIRQRLGCLSNKLD